MLADLQAAIDTRTAQLQQNITLLGKLHCPQAIAAQERYIKTLAAELQELNRQWTHIYLTKGRQS